jgi:hypothetical protein
MPVRIFKFLGLIALAVALGLGTMVGAAAAQGPADVLKAFFTAAGKGDLAACKSMSTGELAQKLPQPKTRGFRRMKRIGVSFQSVENVKVKGDMATAVVMLDKQKLVQAFVDSIMAYWDRTHKPDPKARDAKFQQVKNFALGFAERVNRFDALVTKKSGKWLVSRLAVCRD